VLKESPAAKSVNGSKPPPKVIAPPLVIIFAPLPMETAPESSLSASDQNVRCAFCPAEPVMVTPELRMMLFAVFRVSGSQKVILPVIVISPVVSLPIIISEKPSTKFVLNSCQPRSSVPPPELRPIVVPFVVGATVNVPLLLTKPVVPKSMTSP